MLSLSPLSMSSQTTCEFVVVCEDTDNGNSFKKSSDVVQTVHGQQTKF